VTKQTLLEVAAALFIAAADATSTLERGKAILRSALRDDEISDPDARRSRRSPPIISKTTPPPTGHTPDPAELRISPKTT